MANLDYIFHGYHYTGMIEPNRLIWSQAVVTRGWVLKGRYLVASNGYGIITLTSMKSDLST